MSLNLMVACKAQCHNFKHHKSQVFGSKLKNTLNENYILEKCQHLSYILLEQGMIKNFIFK